MSKRRSVRVPLEVLIKYDQGGQKIANFSSDLGEKGIFIETHSPAAVGSVFEIIITLPHNNSNIVLKGRVVWVRTAKEGAGKAGMGIEFIELGEALEKKLQTAIEHYKSLL
jgi:uncharacterized protein (TIGR02266 family)